MLKFDYMDLTSSFITLIPKFKSIPGTIHYTNPYSRAKKPSSINIDSTLNPKHVPLIFDTILFSVDGPLKNSLWNLIFLYF